MQANNSNNNSLENSANANRPGGIITPLIFPNQTSSESQSGQISNPQLLSMNLTIPIPKAIFSQIMQRQSADEISVISNKLKQNLNNVMKIKSKEDRAEEIYYKNLCNAFISHAIDLNFNLTPATNKTFEARINEEFLSFKQLVAPSVKYSSTQEEEAKREFSQCIQMFLNTEISPFVEGKKTYFIRDFSEYVVDVKDEVSAYTQLIENQGQNSFITPRSQLLKSSTELRREEREKYNTIEREAGQITRINANMTEKTQSLLETQATLRAELYELTQKEQKTSEENSTLKLLTGSLQTELLAAKHNINLEQIPSDFQQQFRGQIELNVSLESEKDNLNQLLQQEIQKNTTLTGKNETLTLEKNVSERRLNDLQQEKDGLHNENLTLAADKSVLETDKARRKEKYDALKTKYTTSVVKEKEIEESFQDLSARFDDRESEIAALQQGKRNLHAEISQLRNSHHLKKMQVICTKISKIEKDYTPKNPHRASALKSLLKIKEALIEYQQNYQQDPASVASPETQIDNLKERLINIYMFTERDHRNKKNLLIKSIFDAFDNKTESRLATMIKKIIDTNFDGVDYDAINAMKLVPSPPLNPAPSTIPLFDNITSTTTTTTTTTSTSNENQQIHEMEPTI